LNDEMRGWKDKTHYPGFAIWLSLSSERSPIPAS
jgi:hypothetical protein